MSNYAAAAKLAFTHSLLGLANVLSPAVSAHGDSRQDDSCQCCGFTVRFAVDCRTMSEETTEVYHNMEICATIIFTVEYALRLVEDCGHVMWHAQLSC